VEWDTFWRAPKASQACITIDGLSGGAWHPPSAEFKINFAPISFYGARIHCSPHRKRNAGCANCFWMTALARAHLSNYSLTRRAGGWVGGALGDNVSLFISARRLAALRACAASGGLASRGLRFLITRPNSSPTDWVTGLAHCCRFQTFNCQRTLAEMPFLPFGPQRFTKALWSWSFAGHVVCHFRSC
jgi:hypothetical protein